MSDPQNPASTPESGGDAPPPPASTTPPPPAYGEAAPAYGQQPPAYGEQAPAAPAYGSQPPAYEAPAYPAAPQYTAAPEYSGSGAPQAPGRTMGIVAFVLSFFAQPIALILGIIALVQSRKAGQKNGFALAAIIISAVLMVIGIIVAVLLLSALGAATNDVYDQYLQNCGPGGSGFVEIFGERVPCEQIDSSELQ